MRELLVPADSRWKRGPQRESCQARRLMTSAKKMSLGRGGIALALENAEPLFEGEVVEFDLRVSPEQGINLRGTGIVRYIKKGSNHTTWGIEFASLDDASLGFVLNRNSSERSISYIPSILN
jgi:hypothetical protein